jgi:hypothetical protein
MSKLLGYVLCVVFLGTVAVLGQQFTQESETYDWRPYGGVLWNDADTPGQLHLYQYYERRMMVDVPAGRAVRGWYGMMVKQERKQQDIKTYEESIYWVEYYPVPQSKRVGSK